MRDTGELTDKIAGAVSALTGLRLESSIKDGVRLPWPSRSTAIDLGDGLVEIRVVATTLPLPPLLESVTAAVEPLLADTRWSGATVRLVVTQLDASALGAGP
ncbi:MAG: uncharacterized protein JWN03_1050 [Nocardia sp.]|uniref:hypothetical protein n=1 Tax=Nocardia sp. TaxID=1821 RepID=UPI00260346CD|nr:hypothetical protein [Nocardia sp.]MCU1640775.1 uncharacterized protein [Nocardia sp.]